MTTLFKKGYLCIVTISKKRYYSPLNKKDYGISDK